MTVQIGSKLGAYEVIGHLGSGGMGEVYRARDPRLSRNVAIKTLPPEFARDPDRVARFTREAQAVAAFNHPNIAAIHGLESGDGFQFIVLELVEGETLAERLARGPIEFDDVVEIAKQIAAALEAAHDKGIVHRDLKPANIKITPEGRVKVLDFGLAKMNDPASGPGTAGTNVAFSQSPTLLGGTLPGVIMGTAQYMSPEQARGKSVDKRTDIWSFGCVLFEMLTGGRLFIGEDVMQVMAAILRSDPDWQSIPPHAASLQPILRRCLQRDPERRLRDIRDVRIALEDRGESRATVSSAVPTKRSLMRSPYFWLAASIAGLILFGAGVATRPFLTAVPDRTPLYLSIVPPEGEQLLSSPTSAALSPDGQYVAFVTGSGDPTTSSRNRLWIRRIDSPDARVIEGSEQAFAPFWSPDSRRVAFFANSGLKKVRADGGRPETIADTSGVVGPRRSGTWSANDVILVGLDVGQPLFAVSANGGKLTAQTTIDNATGLILHVRPDFLPDGKHYFFGLQNPPGQGKPRDTAGTYVSSLGSTEAQPIISGLRTTVHYDPTTRHIIYSKLDGLWAQPFDISKLQVDGASVKILESVAFDENSAAASGFSVSNNRSLLYRPAPSTIRNTQLTWFDRSGNQLATVGRPGDNRNPRLSPDGSKIAVTTYDGSTPALWVMDSASQQPTRLTFDQGGTTPIWSSDGKTLMFNSNGRLTRKLASGDGAEEQVLPTMGGQFDDHSPDGNYAVISMIRGSTNRDVLLVRLHGDPAPQPFAATVANEQQSQISPDGKWIAYVSDSTGQSEVYVETFPVPGSKRMVTTNGGVQPKWRRDGKELFYVAPDSTLMSVPITGNSPLSFAPHIALFKTPSGAAIGIGTRAQYDVSPDGQRILINVRLSEPEPPPIHILLNWDVLLRKNQ